MKIYWSDIVYYLLTAFVVILTYIFKHVILFAVLYFLLVNFLFSASGEMGQVRRFICGAYVFISLPAIFTTFILPEFIRISYFEITIAVVIFAFTAMMIVDEMNPGSGGGNEEEGEPHHVWDSDVADQWQCTK